MSVPVTSHAGMADTEKTFIVDAQPTDAVSDTEKEAINSEDIYIDPQRERKLLWKTDAFLVPLLTLSFLSAYLDRSNIGNAAIAGMPEDLDLTDQQLAST